MLEGEGGTWEHRGEWKCVVEHLFSLLPFYCFSGSPARKMASSTLIKEGSVRAPAVPHVTGLSMGKAKDAPASPPKSMLT